MAMDRESRSNRILNVAILAGVMIVISGMMAVPRDGPASFVDDWLRHGLPYLAIGLVGLAIVAPRYIRGGKA